MINLPLATDTWDAQELAIIKEVIDSGRFTLGPHVSKFESLFAEFTGSKYAIMVNSGSSANLLAVAALFYVTKNRLKRGDEVIVPAVSWATTYYPLSQYGLKLKFVDIDLHTLNYDLEALETAITEETRMIVAVNLLGNPNDFSAIQKMTLGKDIIVMEDNCESLGATFNEKQAGTFGIVGTYSTYFSHHISTMEGGMITTDDEEIYHILLSLRSHGWTRHLPQNNRITDISTDSFYESFRFILPGYNVRPIEFMGALGIEQLKKLPNIIDARRKNARHFQELFSGSKHFTTQKEVGNSSWFGFSLVLNQNSNSSRDDVVKFLSSLSVECRPIVSGNFTRNPVIQWLDYSIHGELKNSNLIHENGLFFGNHHYDIEDKLTRIFEALENFIPQ